MQGAGPGLLEMLCMVASSVEHVAPSHLESPTTSEGSDRSTEEEAAESSRDAPEASHERQHLQLPIAFTEALPASLVTGKLEVSMHKEPSSTAAAVPAAPALEVQAGGDKEAEHDDKVSVPIQEEASPAVVAHTHRSLADEGEALQHGHPAESSDARGSWDSASTHESDESLPRFSSSRSQQAYTADDDDKDAIAGGEASVAVAMTCAERMAASQHQAAGATARSSCARRMAAASTASSPPRHPLHDVPVLRSVEPAVPAPFANLFRSGHVVDEGMSRYPIGR